MENEKSTLTVLMVEPGKAPYQATIGADLKSMQKIVGGYIESSSPYDDPVAIICNEEGKLEQLPFNRGLRDEFGNLYDYIAGNFMIVGLGEENFESLPPEYVKKYSRLFAQPKILNITNGKFEVLPGTSSKLHARIRGAGEASGNLRICRNNVLYNRQWWIEQSIMVCFQSGMFHPLRFAHFRPLCCY